MSTLEELRKADAKIPLAPLTPETKALVEEQKKTGKLIDKRIKNEMMLRKHSTVFDTDNSLLLYRLPLSDEQRSILFEKIRFKSI